MSESPERPARPTGHDVAARAGVSQATVSLALSDPSSTRVSAATRARTRGRASAVTNPAA